jgi:hypothetical protein
MLPRLVLAAGGLASFGLGLLVATPVSAGIRITLSPPGADHQKSAVQSVAGSRTESFDGLAGFILSGSGTLAVGAYSTAGILIIPADIYGGAGGTGKYARVDNNPLTISFPIATRQVGFWWSAASVNDSFQLFDASNNLLATYNLTSLLSLVGSQASPNAVTATDGNVYSGSLYFNNPNPSITTPNNEPYAYVNLSPDDASISIHTIAFKGSRFEFDNLTISPLDSPPSLAAAPAPLPLLGCVAGFTWSRRLRRQRRSIAAAQSENNPGLTPTSGP